MSQMFELRWHGRAGQGVVTASELLGEAAMDMGMYIQAFPEYGSERMGAPIKCYTRISDEPIEIHAPILKPDAVIVVNPNLLGVVDLTEGLAEDGLIIFNTDATPAEIRVKLGFHGGRVVCVDATKIAMEEFRRDIPSTLILGAVARMTGAVEVDTVIEVTKHHLGSRLRPEVVEANVRSIQRAYNECVEG